MLGGLAPIHSVGRCSHACEAARHRAGHAGLDIVLARGPVRNTNCLLHCRACGRAGLDGALACGALSAGPPS
eukprot:14838769-Heterocapsa_arctica.AAC.1